MWRCSRSSRPDFRGILLAGPFRPVPAWVTAFQSEDPAHTCGNGAQLAPRLAAGVHDPSRGPWKGFGPSPGRPSSTLVTRGTFRAGGAPGSSGRPRLVEDSVHIRAPAGTLGFKALLERSPPGPLLLFLRPVKNRPKALPLKSDISTTSDTVFQLTMGSPMPLARPSDPGPFTSPRSA